MRIRTFTDGQLVGEEDVDAPVPASPAPADRIASLEAKVAAAEALASQANATAQDVAQAMRDAGGRGRPS